MPGSANPGHESRGYPQNIDNGLATFDANFNANAQWQRSW
jgi:hypothetical protein